MQAMLLGRRPRFLPPPTPKGLSKAREIREAAPRQVDRKALVELTKGPRGSSKPVLFAACRPTRPRPTPPSTTVPTVRSPTCSCKALAEDPTRTRRDLLTAVTAGLKSGDFEQRSTLEGPPQSKKVPFGEIW